MDLLPFIRASFEIPITPDTLRLLVILAFIYAAVLDYRTRRVYNEFWIPLIGLCFIVLGWDLATLIVNDAGTQEAYLFSFSLSVLVAPSIAYTLWEQDILGGADLKALSFLAVFFPKVPELMVNGRVYPIVDGVTPIFTITVLINALIISVFYRIGILVRNLVKADINRLMTRATRCDTTTLPEKHGDVLDVPNGETSGLDIDAIRMYLQWRGITLPELQSNASFYKTTEPATEREVQDSIPPGTGKTPLGHSRAEYRPPVVETGSAIVPVTPVREPTSDEWGAEQFVDRVENSAATTSVTPSQVRQGLDAITEQRQVWVSPAIPFFIPLSIGLIIAVTYGSLFTGVTEWVAGVIVQLLLT